MNRLICGLAIVAIGCGPGGGTSDGSARDLTGGPVDLAGGDRASQGGAATGGACTTATECAGNKPVCKKTVFQQTAPGGYCSAKCLDSSNDPQNDNINPSCPGNGSCINSECYQLCSGRNNEQPAYDTCRTGYACVNFESTICVPDGLSECDPTDAGAKLCPGDGGSINDTDAGTRNAMVCVDVGQDPFGACWEACDPFHPSCPATQAGAQACYVSDFDTGQATCSGLQMGAEGTACTYINTCDSGLGCHAETSGRKCRTYCHTGTGATTCPMGQTCQKLSSQTSLSTDVVGFCAL